MRKVQRGPNCFAVLELLFVLAFATLTVWAAEPRTVFAQPLKPIVISVSSPREISAAPMLMAKYLGYFKDEGLDPRFVVMSSDIA